MKYNYIIICSDGMRADFANQEDLMPNTYKFLKEYSGLKYTNAYTTATWTLSAFGSLFSGLLPIHHGLDNITYGNRKKIIERDPKFFHMNIRERDILIPMMKKKGYKTVYFGQKLMHRFMSETLFHLFDKRVFWDFFYYQMDKIRNEPLEEPFMYFIYDDNGGHAPYGRLIRDRFIHWQEQKEELGKRFPLDTHVRHYPHLFPRDRLHQMGRGQVKQYDEECLSLFWEWFVDNGLHKNTYVFITSDHGECLRDFGWTGHVYNAYEPVVQIPLLVYNPEFYNVGYKKLNQVSTLKSLVDIMPTILNVPEYGDGQWLFGQQRYREDRVVYFEYKREGFPFNDSGFIPQKPDERVLIRGLRHRQWKFIVSKDYKKRKWEELYDLTDERYDSMQVKDPDLISWYYKVLREVYNDI